MLELMVVVAIILTLLALSTPYYVKAVRMAREAVGESQR